MNKYGMQVLRLSETGWNEFGEITNQLTNFIIYSGSEDEDIRREGRKFSADTHGKSVLVDCNLI